MAYAYSNDGSGTNYTYTLLNTLNQHCAKVNLPAGACVTSVQMYISAVTSTTNCRFAGWVVGGSYISNTASSVFTIPAAGTGGSGLQVISKSIGPRVLNGGDYWFGLYRDPKGSHKTRTKTGGTGYRKTNTAQYSSITSMSGYSTHADKEPYVRVGYILPPNAPSSLSVSRNNDNSQTISWTRNATTDRPYSSLKLYRYNIINGSYSLLKTLSGSATSYTDTTTIANRYYKYRILATNDAGNSGYSNEDTINTTPAPVTNVEATRVGTTVEIEWNNPAINETTLAIERNTSTDGVSWAGWSTLSSLLPTNSTDYTDNSPANFNQYRVKTKCTNPTLESAYTESNIVQTLQIPDPPTGMLPNATAFDANNDQLFSWNHNSLDSTAQNKFSLKIKVSGGTYPKEIDDFSNYYGWTAAGSELAELIQDPPTTKSVYMADYDDTESYVAMYKNISSMDLTQFDDTSASSTDDLIVFDFYIFDITYFTALSIKLGDDNSNCYYHTVNPSTDLVNGWNQIAVAKSAFSTAGSPSGWDDITYLRVELYALDDSAYNSYIASNYLQLVKATDFSNYAGVYFRQYNEIESATEAFNLIADSFKNGNTFDYQVKTWGEFATGSLWSDTATFITTSTPIANITIPSVENYAYSELTMEWDYTQAESNDQVQYIAKLYDESDLLLESKNISATVASGGSGTCTFDYPLANNTNYKVTLTVQEQNGLWSELSETEFTTEFLQPMQPTIDVSLDSSDGSVDVDITNPEVVTAFDNLSTQDTYIDSDNPTTNYDDNGTLEVINDTTGGTAIKNILLDFDLSSFVGKSISSATLYLFRSTSLVAGIDSKIQYIDESWDESAVNYNTLPSLNATAYDNHTHTAGDSETWDLTTLVSDIADGVISDYNGLAVIATTTDGSADEFYDSTDAEFKPVLAIEIEPENAETDYNKLYRSVNGGDWELVESNIPINTTVTDHIPNIGGNNNYYVEAFNDSTIVSKASESADIDISMTGLFFINGGEGFEEVIKIIGDVNYSESKGIEETIKKYEGRDYPVRYQSNNKYQEITFTSDLPVEYYDTLFDIIEYAGPIFYRDWRGRWFDCQLSNPRVLRKDNFAYTFSCNIIRLQHQVNS